MSKERRSGPSLHLEWSPGQVQAVDIATEQRWLGSSLKELPASLTGHREAIVGIRRNLVFLKCVPLPKAAPDDLRRILAVQIGQLFPLPADQLAFDFVQTTEQTTDGWLTMVAAVRAEDLRQLNGDLQQAGIKATRILPVAMGAPAVAARSGHKDALVIEAGPSGYSLDVVKGGVVRLSRIAVSGSDLRGEAQRTLAAANVGELPLVTVGAENVLPRGDSFTSSTTALAELQEAPPFTFELDEDRAREVQRRVTVRSRLAALMMMSALLLVALVWVDRSDAQQVVQHGQATWNSKLSRLRSISDTEIAKAQVATAQEAGLKSAFETGQPLSDIAIVIGDSLPPTAWLTGLNLERGKVVQIRGTASDPNDVPRFLHALAATNRFRDIKLIVANTARINETTVIQFNVTATAIGNLPMPAPQKNTPGKARAASTSTSTSGSTAGGASGGDGATGAAGGG